MVSFLAAFILAAQPPSDTLVELGIPKAAAASFRKLIAVPIRKQWVKTGNDAPLKFKPDATNPVLEEVLKTMTGGADEARQFAKNMDQGFASQGLGDDASQFVTMILGIGIEASGHKLNDDAPQFLSKQVRFLCNQAKWSSASLKERNEAANVARALVVIQVMASAASDKTQGAKLNSALMSSILGRGAELSPNGDYFSFKPAEETKPDLLVSELTLTPANGYLSKSFDGRPGLTKVYPDYPGTTDVNFVLLPRSSRPYTDFLGAWSSALPGKEWSGNPEQLPLARYVGNGIRATMSHGQIKRNPEGFLNMIVLNIENGSGSQTLVGYYQRADLFNQIVRDFEGVLAKLDRKGATKAPLTTYSQLVGTWTTHGASQMGYFNSSGEMTGVEAIDRGVEYTFKADGTYSYYYQGVTGVVGSMQVAQDRETGTYKIDGDSLNLKPQGKGTKVLRLRGVQKVGDSKVLLLGNSEQPIEAEFAYIEKYVPKS